MERPEYLKQMEEIVEDNLIRIRTRDYEDEKERRALVTETTVLIERLHARDESEMEYDDKQKRREMEERKNQELLKVERKKLHMPLERIALSVGEIVIPLCFMAALVPYMAEFESTGRVCSSVGRMIWSMPKNLIKMKW